MHNEEYPRWKYHARLGGQIVHSAEEEAALGYGWSENIQVLSEKSRKIVADKQNPPVAQIVAEPEVVVELKKKRRTMRRKRRT